MKYLLKRIFTLIITLFIVSLLAFLAFHVISDPASAMLGTSATPESLAALREKLGLDRPIPVQYMQWLLAFLQGDFGSSYSYSMPVVGMIAQKLPITALLTFLSFVVMIVIAIPLGIFSARWEGGVLDRSLTVINQIFMSIPPFLLGVVFTYLFGIGLRLFVPGSFVSYTESWPGFLNYLIFPSLAIAIPRIAMTVKMLRSSILNQMGREYVRTARSRGSTKNRILTHHVLRNAIIPVITFIATSMAEIVASSIIIEQVFAIPGIGVLLLSSINNRDFPVVQAIVMILVCWVVLVNFIADLLYQYMDPRIRLD